MSEQAAPAPQLRGPPVTVSIQPFVSTQPKQKNMFGLAAVLLVPPQPHPGAATPAGFARAPIYLQSY